jgi:hypothetical protein
LSQLVSVRFRLSSGTLREWLALLLDGTGVEADVMGDGFIYRPRRDIGKFRKRGEKAWCARLSISANSWSAVALRSRPWKAPNFSMFDAGNRIVNRPAAR